MCNNACILKAGIFSIVFLNFGRPFTVANCFSPPSLPTPMPHYAYFTLQDSILLSYILHAVSDGCGVAIQYFSIHFIYNMQPEIKLNKLAVTRQIIIQMLVFI